MTVWTQGIFDLSRFTLDALLDALDESDFGAFVFTPDDVRKMRGEEFRVARDNVVFELGLFIGRLGKERSFILLPRGFEDFNLPTDLLGITPGTYEARRQDGNLTAALGPACNKIRKQTEKLGQHRPPRAATETIVDEEHDFDDMDIYSLVKQWMGRKPSGDSNTEELFSFRDIERDTGIPRGTAAKVIEKVGAEFDMTLVRLGKSTVVFRNPERDDDIPF